MKLRFVRQEENLSSGCGPACVAMVTGVSWRRAAQTMWPGKTRGYASEYKDIKRTLTKLGANFAPKATKITSFGQIKTLSIVACKWREVRDEHHWHWIVFNPKSGFVFDPLAKGSAKLGLEKLDTKYRPFSALVVSLRECRLPET